jgi:hypothetical protein
MHYLLKKSTKILHVRNNHNSSCTRQSIVEREGLEHDERSEEERVRQHLVQRV